MTAAHKTLPLPTYVRVRNLRNEKSIIVRVNDRGPFVDNRIIDLSYSAALKLDMIRDGTSLVEVEAINFEEPVGDRPTRQTTPASPASGPTPAEPEESNDIYAQVGAFSDRANAERQLALLLSRGIGNALIYADLSAEPALHRVRVGPITNTVQYDVLVEELERLGIPDPYLVTE
jgi:rare lipoprotein A